jgi:iron-sulfur cluster assembly accessory protein
MTAAPVTLSPAAAARVAQIAARQTKPAILRLSVEGGGCSGFQYRFDLAETPSADDSVTETDGVKLVVDPVSLDLVAGCTVDFVESLGGAAFRVENPNATAGCGCGIKARLPRLLEWLEETAPDVACLQEVKSQDEGFPHAEFEKIGYGSICHGQKGFNGVAILARSSQPVEVCRGLDGDPEDVQSRYLEADVNGVRVACIYLPNGNPQPGPKFDYKLRWMERLQARMREILAEEVPAVVTGDHTS